MKNQLVMETKNHRYFEVSSNFGSWRSAIDQRDPIYIKVGNVSTALQLSQAKQVANYITEAVTYLEENNAIEELTLEQVCQELGREIKIVQKR